MTMTALSIASTQIVSVTRVVYRPKIVPTVLMMTAMVISTVLMLLVPMTLPVQSAQKSTALMGSMMITMDLRIVMTHSVLETHCAQAQ